jgi:hypothetical protein
MLPIEDVDLEAMGPLIRITGLAPPYQPRPGRAWMTEDDSDGRGGASAQARGMARLAAFLLAELGREPRPISSALRPVAIHVMHQDTKDIVYVENAEKTLILWAEPPGQETPGQPTASQRWTELHDWQKRRPAEPVLRPYYLDFSRDGIVIKRGGG